MKLIIQIPCLNEAETLHRVALDLPVRIEGIDSIETLIVDDGSSDGTAEAAIALGVDHVVRHNRNRGLAAAFASGLDAALEAGADVIVNTDGDHQYPGGAIERLVEPIVAGRADLVVGDRRPGEDPRFSPLKRFLQRLGRRVVSWLAGRDLPDPVSGFRAYSRAAAEQTHIVTGYSYTIESLLQASCKGLAIEFVPIETNPPTRPSRLFRSLPQFVCRSALTMLRVFFMFHLLGVLASASAALALVGLVPILRFLYLYGIGQGDGHLQSLVLGGVLVILAAVILVAGLLADLISHNRRLLEKTLERLPRQRSDDTAGSLPHLSANQADSVDFVAQPTDRRRVRSGLTLIELVIVIAIIGVLAALLMPAVQWAREAARRVQCGNHLRQIALGATLHHDTHGHFPTGGWGWGWHGDPDRGFGRDQPGGWVYNLLPFIEQVALRELGSGLDEAAKRSAGKAVAEQALALMNCPSRRSPTGYPFVLGTDFFNIDRPELIARSDYAANLGDDFVRLFGTGPMTLDEGDDPGHIWVHTELSGLVFRRSQIAFRDITAGTSNTYLIGEKYLQADQYHSGLPRNDDQGMYVGFDQDTLATTHADYPPQRDAIGVENNGAFGSAHGSGFQMSYADGSVRLIGYDIDHEVHRSAGNRRQ